MGITYQIPGRTTAELDRAQVASYWREQFIDEPYYSEGERFEDYESAYIAGHEARLRDVGRAYEQVEAEIHQRWEANKGTRSLSWSKARHAVRRAWEQAAQLGPRRPGEHRG